jgi:hypothetical protein
LTPPGHLAVAYLLVRGRARSEGGGRAVALAWCGAMLPDVADKSLQWLGRTLYGRTVGHSALLWALCGAGCLLASRGATRSEQRGASLMLLGWLSHLVIDLIDDAVEGLERSGYAFSGWFAWPLTNPDMWNVRVPHLLDPMPHAVTSLELATVAACVWHLARFSATGPSRAPLARANGDAS